MRLSFLLMWYWVMKQLSPATAELTYITCITGQSKIHTGSKKWTNRGNGVVTCGNGIICEHISGLHFSWQSANCTEVCLSLERKIISFLRKSSASYSPHNLESAWGMPSPLFMCISISPWYTSPRHWVVQIGPVSWPPHLPALTSLDYALWDDLKDDVYWTALMPPEYMWWCITAVRR
jgi:hypothetical protein